MDLRAGTGETHSQTTMQPLKINTEQPHLETFDSELIKSGSRRNSFDSDRILAINNTGSVSSQVEPSQACVSKEGFMGDTETSDNISYNSLRQKVKEKRKSVKSLFSGHHSNSNILHLNEDLPPGISHTEKKYVKEKQTVSSRSKEIKGGSLELSPPADFADQRGHAFMYNRSTTDPDTSKNVAQNSEAGVSFLSN